MKKFTLLASMACMLLGTPAMAQTQSVYGFANFSDTKVLDLFADVLKKGRQYPTMEEFQSIGIDASDLAFIRSHVRPRALVKPEEHLVEGVQAGRNLWMNIPMGAGKGGDAGYPSGNFTSDVYSMWNYTNLFGSWNHSILKAPGAWVDAAHKHGTNIFSGIKFFDTTGARTEGSGNWINFITKMEGDKFKYAEPLINALMYFGSDGINYNWEAGGATTTNVVQFHKQLWKIAAEKGFTNYRSGFYSNNYSTLPAGAADDIYGTKANGRTHDLMLNYMGGDFTNDYMLKSSIAAAKNAMGNTDGLYTGVWIVSMDRGWNRVKANPEIGICLWGEHDQSRFYSYNSGKDAFDTQRNYQRLLERGFSGGKRNPLSRPELKETGNNWEKDGDKAPLSTFCGLAEFIPERSTVNTLPFATNFNLGNGERFNYKGIKTAGEWYNMGAQDMMPTYRWLVYQVGTTNVSTSLQPEFSHDDAYIGGSSLELKGDAAPGTDIVLYKTDLKVEGKNPYVRLAVKNAAGAADTHLAVILKVNGQWKEFPYQATSDTKWEEKTIAGDLKTGDVITEVGLRVQGGGANYHVNVGKLEINDDTHARPAELKNLMIEKKNETNKSLTAKLYWEVNQEAGVRKAQGLLYNDEANIDHFEVLCRDGQNGAVRLVGITSQWAALIPNLSVEEYKDPWIGVRAVSTDLKNYSTVQWKRLELNPNAPAAPEIDPYGKSEIDPNAAGLDIARQNRYVTKLTIKGATGGEFNYTTVEHPESATAVNKRKQYHKVADQVLKVKQGDKLDLHMVVAAKNDGLKYCLVKGWMDLDGSYTFNGTSVTSTTEEGELLFDAGSIRAGSPEFESTGINKTITIPADARPGKSRLRIVFSDAWFAGTLSPTGLTSKGFTLDVDVEISGDASKVRGAVDTHDKGDAQEPERVHDVDPYNPTAIATTDATPATVRVAGDKLLFQHVDAASVYTTDGRLVATSAGESLDVKHFVPGVYMVQLQSGDQTKTAKVVLR